MYISCMCRVLGCPAGPLVHQSVLLCRLSLQALLSDPAPAGRWRSSLPLAQAALRRCAQDPQAVRLSPKTLQVMQAESFSPECNWKTPTVEAMLSSIGSSHASADAAYVRICPAIHHIVSGGPSPPHQQGVWFMNCLDIVWAYTCFIFTHKHN